ncbi:unnamed protein product, partial [Hymenolepis diminuta]
FCFTIKLRSLEVSRRILSPAASSVSWNFSPSRTVFSFFKRKKKNDGGTSGGKAESETSHAELLWAEASKTFTQDKLVKSSKSAPSVEQTLKHSQIKAIKKSAFLDTVELYKARSGTARRGFNEFILTALKQMKEYEVADDLEAYKALLSVLPRGGRLKAKSFLHADMGAFKQQQDTVTRLLMQLNANQVMPDDDVGNTIVEVFGFRSYVMTQYRRIMYWVPKLRHANPWPVLEHLPDDLEGEDAIRLAHLVAARICPDPNTEFFTAILNEENGNPTPGSPNSIVSAQSVIQRALLSAYVTTLKNNAMSSESRVLYLDGPQFVWYRNLQLSYYVLWGHLDEQRLRTQVRKTQEEKERLKSIPDPTSWDYPIPGSEREKFIPLVPVASEESALPPLQILEQENALRILRDADLEESIACLQPKKNSLARRGSVSTAERRRALWAVDPQHQSALLTHLPESLSRHEQGEGTILAVGVVTPISSALESQKRAYGDEETLGTHPNSLPLPAPASLIQEWLNGLRKVNPALDRATVVIRNQIP